MRRWQRPWAGWERRVEGSFTQEEEGSVTEVQEGEEVVEGEEEVGSEGGGGATSLASKGELNPQPLVGLITTITSTTMTIPPSLAPPHPSHRGRGTC